MKESKEIKNKDKNLNKNSNISNCNSQVVTQSKKNNNTKLIITVLILGILLALMTTLFVLSLQENRKISLNLEDFYQKNFYELVDNINNTETKLAKTISANDINNYHNKQFPSGGYGDVVLFWSISLDNKSVEEIKAVNDSVNTIEKMQIDLYGQTEENIVNSHYIKLKKSIFELNKFFKCDIGNMKSKNEILFAYEKLKTYYENNINEISREDIFCLIKNIYIAHYIFIDNNNYQDAEEKSNELLSKQIENTNLKKKEHWIR